MFMKIHVLIENTAVRGMIAEHGLSLLIEEKGKKYLLDAGTTGAFLKNAEMMSLDVNDVECCVLSHGHYDHSGGFAEYLAQNITTNVYAMETVKGEYYSGSGGTIHDISVPGHVLPAYEERFVFINEVTKIAENVYLLPHCTAGLEKIGERAKLFKKKDGRLEADDFSHELSLVIDSEKGLLICNSCSHAGVRNIISEVKQVFPAKKIHAFVGGLHMKGRRDGEEICTFSEEEVKEMAEYLVMEGVEKVYTGHCTGEVAYEMLKKYLGNRLGKLKTGITLEL